MGLWLILVTLPAAFFRILCRVVPTSVWSRFMKNRITHMEPDPNEVISDIVAKDEFCLDDSYNSSMITNTSQSEILHLSSVTCEKDEKSREDEFYSELSMKKQNIIVANCLGDKTNEPRNDDSNYVSAHQTSTTSIPQKEVTTDKMLVNRHSNSILTKDKNANFSETNDQISDSVSGGEITDEESAEKISDDESGDETTNGEFAHKIIDEEFADKIPDEKSGVKISNKESGEKITDKESSDKMTGRKFEDQTTGTLDTNNDNGESNKYSDHECHFNAKNLIDEESSTTSSRNILHENSSEIDDCQRTLKRYFVHKNNEILDIENFCAHSNLDISEDKSAQMYEHFHISTTNEISECECYYEIKDIVSVIPHENSGECRPDVCETNDSHKCSLDNIPMEFIYPCLPHSMYNC